MCSKQQKLLLLIEDGRAFWFEPKKVQRANKELQIFLEVKNRLPIAIASKGKKN